MTDGRPRQPGQPPRTSGGVKASVTWEKRIRAAFTERLPYKATAIFFSLVLWLVVSAEEPASGPVPVQFQPVMDTSLSLVGGLPNVTAYVVGSRSDLQRLTRTPLSLHVTVPPTAPDSLVVRLSDLPLTLPSGVNVQVARFQPETVVLRFASEASRMVPVRSELRLVDDFGRPITAVPSFEPDSVSVIGPRVRVRALETVPTVGGELIVRDTQAIPVAIDTAGLGVRVTPMQVRMRLPVMPDTTPPDTTLRNSGSGL